LYAVPGAILAEDVSAILGWQRYAIVLEPEPGAGGFSVHIPAFPEAHTQGETIEECLTNAREVIELCLDVRRDEGSASE